MRYVGADIHKQYTFFCVLTQEGKVEKRVRVENTPDLVREFLRQIPRPAHLALEASYHWQPFFELVEETDIQVSLAHPFKVKLIAEAKIKTDTIDATTLAHLLRLDYLPTAYIPPRKVRDLRETLRHRAKLVATRTQVKNRIHALLTKSGIRHRFTDLFGKKGRLFLEGLRLRPSYQLALDQDLALLDVLNHLIAEVTRIIEEKAQANPEAMLLTTMPGISYYSALLILAEIGDILYSHSLLHLPLLRENAEEGILLVDVSTDVSHGYTSYSTRLGQGVGSFMVSEISILSSKTR